MPFYLAQLTQESEGHLKERQAKNSWSTEKSLNELYALDFHKPNAVFDFYVETQDIVLSYRPLPILLGQDSGYWYYLTSEDCADPP
jgi:hypothetical protein